MNLIIDLGNTFAKVFCVQEEIILSETRFPAHDTNALISYLQSIGEPVKGAILSSVISHPLQLEAALRESFFTVVLDHRTPLPIINRYATPQTLGKDRLAAAAGASLQFKGKNVLAIDAGTCIKYDMLTAQGEYLGGGISPGIEMRFKALNTFTDKLPLLTKAKTVPLIGTDTEGSIYSGVQNGVMEEVKGIIGCYRMEFNELNVVFTGGDMAFFIPLVSGKNAIFADPWLVLKGLNAILEHNAAKNI